MSSDQKASSENGRKRFFDSRREEMEKVKPLLDLGLWKCAYGDEDFKDLLDNLAEEIERKKRILPTILPSVLLTTSKKATASMTTGPIVMPSIWPSLKSWALSRRLLKT